MNGEVKSASRATGIALAFIRQDRPYARPIKAVREGAVWLVEIDVGPLLTVIAKVKVDANTGDILEYTIPT